MIRMMDEFIADSGAAAQHESALSDRKPCSESPDASSVWHAACSPIAIPLTESLEVHMDKIRQWRSKQEGKLGYILLWALGVPIPVLFVIFLLRGCT